jgi:hypothetical protein
MPMIVRVEGAIRRVALCVVLVGVVACSEPDDEGNGGACPAGTTRRDSINELAGPAPGSREDAVRVELENLGMDASDDAIAAAVIAAGPGGDVGTEETEVETSQGVIVSMSLEPMDPGWTVGRSSWCAPG